jgi:hypothetical protein
VTLGPNHELLVDGAPFLPIMQFAQCAWRIADEKALGINTFVGNGCSGDTDAEFLDDCAAQGVWGLVASSDLSLASHSALLGWVFGDEPDLAGNEVEPSAIRTEYETIKGQDPNHPTFLTLTAGFYSEMSVPAWMGGSRDRYFDYCDATDLVGFDIYPVYGWCRPDRLYQVGAAQAELIGTYAPDRGTFQWIECARTSSQWCELSARGEDDGPTPAEVRNEVWQAIVAGATAIGYFTHSWECPDYTQLCLSPAQEAELTAVNAELTALTGPILAPRYSGSVSADAGGGHVELSAREHGGAVYLFAVSLDTTSYPVSFSVSGMQPDAMVEVFGEPAGGPHRTLPATGTNFSDTFAALAEHVYVVPLPGAATDAGPTADGGDADAAADGAAHGGDGAEVDRAARRGLTGGCACAARSSSTRGPLWAVALGSAAVVCRRRRRAAG